MTEQPINKPELQRLINERFNRDEVLDLCLHLGIDDENVSAAETKNALVRELIKYCSRRDRLADLVNVCEEARSNMDWTIVTSAVQAEPAVQPAGLVANRDELVQPMQVHRYSGEWMVENRFRLWRKRRISGNDMVYFHGRTFLFISPDGTRGSGTQIGQLFVRIGDHKATFRVANRINRATVTEEGVLKLVVEVFVRKLVEPKDKTAAAILEKELFGSQKIEKELPGSQEFELSLRPVRGQANKLQGQHTYKVGNDPYQLATEDYDYIGF